MTHSPDSFLSEIKGHRSSIADFIQYCRRGELAATDRAVMLERTRVVAEAAATNGYKKIANASQAFNGGLLAGVSGDELIALAQAFFDACHEALIVLPSAALVRPPITARRFFGQVEKLRLLTVDDDRAVRAIIYNLFADYAAIIETGDGLAGLEAVKLYRPDIVLLDDTMPDMSGLAVIERLHADPDLRNTSVIMLTSSDGSRDLARAFSAGAIDYVTKPFDPLLLFEKVIDFLRRLKKIA